MGLYSHGHEGKKICTKCKKVRFFNSFYPNKHTKDGRQSNCKFCCEQTRHSPTLGKVNPRLSEEEKRNRIRSRRRYNEARRRAAQPALAYVHKRAITEIYSNRPLGCHVDHIFPLKAVNENGEHVACGLHVPWNLQYLPAKENIKKSNKIL